MKRTIHVHIDGERWSYLDAEPVIALLTGLDGLSPYPVPAGELSVALMEAAAHCDLHERFLGDPSPTDVITFPGDAEMDFAGEICVNCDQALQESCQRGTTFADELSLYLVHGWLHLAGLDDTTYPERALMRAAEQELLALARTHDYLPTSLNPPAK